MAPRRDRGPYLSRDGKFYWDGHRWVPVPRQTRSTALPAAVLAVIMILGAAWLLNNTRLGYEIKCRFLGDSLACLTILVTAPAPRVPEQPRATPIPAVTESPEERALREAQARVDAAAGLATSSIGQLGSEVDEYAVAIGEIELAVGEGRSALDEMRHGYESDFLVELAVRPMDDFQEEAVLFSLENLAFARESITFALEAVDWAEDDATARRADALSAADAGRTHLSRLERELAAHPGTSSSLRPAAARAAIDAHVAKMPALDARRDRAVTEGREIAAEGDSVLDEAESQAEAIGID